MADPIPETLSILVIGPSPDLIGGMATVVGNHLSLRDPRVQISFVALPRGNGRGLFRSVVRHVMHTVRLIRTIGLKNVPILHLHTCSGATFWRTTIDMFVARAWGCKVVLHVHGGEFEEFYSRSGSLSRIIIRHSLQLADRVIALSSKWKRTLVCMAPYAKVSAIENAVENPPTYHRTNSNISVCRFLLLAKMDESKGVFDALDACRTLVDKGIRFHFTLAGPSGTAGDASMLNAKIKDLGLDHFVLYVGPAEGQIKERLFENCDVLLLPSWYEGMPITILEAMVRSIAVIATNIGAIPEIITDGVHGLLVPPRDPSAIAAAMCKLIESPAQCAELAQAGMRIVDDRFSISRFHRDLIDLYAELSDACSVRTISTLA